MTRERTKIFGSNGARNCFVFAFLSALTIFGSVVLFPQLLVPLTVLAAAGVAAWVVTLIFWG